MASRETTDFAHPIIEKIAKARRATGAFAYYEDKDVYQEVWCMCLAALDRYDPALGPLENYLNRHVANRMKNLRRDKYFRPGFDISSSGHAWVRMNLINALPIDNCDTIEEGTLLGSARDNCEPIHFLLCEETLNYIRSKLPDDLVQPFEDCIGYNTIRKPIILELQEKIAEILTERDQDGNIG